MNTNTDTVTTKGQGRGKTDRAYSFASVSLADLVAVLGADAQIPVARKFAEKLNVKNSPFKASPKAMSAFSVKIVSKVENGDGSGQIVASVTSSESATQVEATETNLDAEPANI